LHVHIRGRKEIAPENLLEGGVGSLAATLQYGRPGFYEDRDIRKARTGSVEDREIAGKAALAEMFPLIYEKLHKILSMYPLMGYETYFCGSKSAVHGKRSMI